MKLAALSKEYFANGWNIFDLVIVVASLLDLGLESVDGISVMRGMRLVGFLLINLMNPSFQPATLHQLCEETAQGQLLLKQQ